ncbi:hypothetical protein BLOT_011250 [Blomia tropicalis]|nr:hypothetical protein BLOT_011250 [Blomia tropicalis]
MSIGISSNKTKNDNRQAQFLNELKRNERVPYSVQFVLNENGGHKFRFDHHHHHRKLEANNLFIFNDEDEDGNGGGGKSCLTR